jgi:hypothetical protein
LCTICTLGRTDSIATKIHAHLPFAPFQRLPADRVVSRRTVPILAFAMSPFSGNLVLGADLMAIGRNVLGRTSRLSPTSRLNAN